MIAPAGPHAIFADQKAVELSARGWSIGGEAGPSPATDVARVLPWCAEAARRAAGISVSAIVLHRPVWDDMDVVACAADDAAAREALISVTDPRSAWQEAHARGTPHGPAHALASEQLQLLEFGRVLLGTVGESDVFVFPIGTSRQLIGLLAVVPADGVELDTIAVDLLCDIAECIRVLVSVVRTAGNELHRATMLEELLLAGTRLSENLPVRSMLRLWCDAVCRATAFQNVFLGLYSESGRDGFRYRHAIGWRAADDPGYEAITRLRLGRLLEPRFMSEGCALIPFEAVKELIPDAVEESFLNAAGPNAWNNHWLLVPLYGPTGEIVGLARLDDPVDLLVPSTERLRAIRAFANHVTQTIALRTVRRRLSRLAATDPLTRLPNRRAYAYRLGSELAQAKRHGGPFAVVAVDFDELKTINDTRGHAAGDAALVQLARALKGSIRAEDDAFRTGGDEFALLLPGASPRDAEEVVERVRAALATFEDSLSASFGVAVRPDDGDDSESLTRAADEAMYQDKLRRTAGS
jgi:diguanylate cyclase (GGDEF)-like protein